MDRNTSSNSYTDFKKYCISHIVLPYLVNVRKLSDNEAFAIMKE
jgi:hypothetical protein